MDAGSEADDSSDGQSRRRRLDSWKEIAAYLNRDVATVRRWEKREGLPVHRHLHQKLGSVFAFTSELDEWASTRRQQPGSGRVAAGTLADSVATDGAQAAVTQDEDAANDGWPAEAPGFRVAWRSTPLFLATVAALGLATLILVWALWRPAGSMETTTRRVVPDFKGVVLAPSIVQFGDGFAVSSDDAMIVFVGQKGEGARQLYVQKIAEMTVEEPRPLPGTEDAISPFFAPDDQFVGFFAGGKLKKVAVGTGGMPVTLGDAPAPRGGSWGNDGAIVFSPSRVAGTRIMRVSATDGKAPVPVTTLERDEVIHLWPQLLPGGDAILYTASNTIGSFNDATIVVQSLKPGGGRDVIHAGGYHARYLESGHIVFLHDGTLFAMAFDLERRKMLSEPEPGPKDMSANESTGGAQFTVSSRTGTLVYLSGGVTGRPMAMSWLDSQGNSTPLAVPPARWFTPRVAPSGDRIAVEIRGTPTYVGIYDLSAGTLAPLTGRARTQRPVWARGRNSRLLAFSATPQNAPTGAPNLHYTLLGSDRWVRLTESSNQQYPGAFDSTTTILVFEEVTSTTRSDVMMLQLEGDEKAGLKPKGIMPFVNTPAMEFDPDLSRDDRWLAYVQSIDPGRTEVIVKSFPDGARTVNLGPGINPTWSRATNELFYSVGGQVMVVPYREEGGRFVNDTPRRWSPGRHQTRGVNRMFDVHPDGGRVALAPFDEQANTLVFVGGFTENLRRTAPPPMTRSQRSRPRPNAALSTEVQPHAEHHATRVHNDVRLAEVGPVEVVI